MQQNLHQAHLRNSRYGPAGLGENLEQQISIARVHITNISLTTGSCTLGYSSKGLHRRLVQC
jgi:hypothetical protein